MSEESESIRHIKHSIENDINHLVRHNEDIEGSIRLTVNVDGTYDIYVHQGTGTEALCIESVSKDKMLGMLEDKL